MLCCPTCGLYYSADVLHCCLASAPIVQQQPQMGWQCPVCGNVYAPHVATCLQNHTQPTTSTNRAALVEDTK